MAGQPTNAGRKRRGPDVAADRGRGEEGRAEAVVSPQGAQSVSGSNKQAIVAICVFTFVVLWRTWLLSRMVQVRVDVEFGPEALDGREGPTQLTADSAGTWQQETNAARFTADADDYGIFRAGASGSIAGEENEGRDQSEATASSPGNTDGDGASGEDYAEGGHGVDDDDDEEEEEEEVVLPPGKRTSVLLSKDMIRAVEEREKTTLAYREVQIAYDKGALAANYASLSAAAGHPDGSNGPKRAAGKPLKNKDIEKHFLKGHWFVPGRKYFVYQPSGGMSNQRIILEHAVLIARKLGRVLVVPPVAPHTSMFWNYNKVEWDRTVEAFHVFQKERMERATPVLGLSNTILRRFVEKNENKFGQRWLRIQREKKGIARGSLWTTTAIFDMFGNVTEDVLFFAQTTMWKSFAFTDEEIEDAQNYVQLDSEFRRVARVASEVMFPNGEPFGGMHIRFEDKWTQLATDVLSPASVFIRRLTKKGVLAVSRKLYVATQPSKISSPYFEPFRAAGFELIFSDSLLNNTEVLSLLDRFPKNDIQSSVLGLLEQLVCARANYFLGTGFSTFSRYIRIKRNNKALLYDETLLPSPQRYDAAFLADCTAAQVVEAFKRGARPQSRRAQERFLREMQLVALPPPCERLVVSTRVC